MKAWPCVMFFSFMTIYATATAAMGQGERPRQPGLLVHRVRADGCPGGQPAVLLASFPRRKPATWVTLRRMPMLPVDGYWGISRPSMMAGTLTTLRSNGAFIPQVTNVRDG